MEARALGAGVVAILALTPAAGAFLHEPSTGLRGVPWTSLLGADHGGLAARLPAMRELTPAALLRDAAPWHPALRGVLAQPAARADHLALTDTVLDAYAAYGIPRPLPAEVARMREAEARMDPALARATAALVGALATHAAVARATAPSDFPAVFQGALRIADAAEAAMAAARAAPLPRAPGPAFQDPYGLVVVGGAGPDTYLGNSLGSALIAPDAQLLVIDLGGDDIYATNAGAAAPMPACLAICGNGLAAAAVLDLGGNDRYEAVAEAAEVDQWSQGSSGVNGVGLLWDAGGDDQYLATHTFTAGIVHYQTVQGSTIGGVAILVDGGGRDRYDARQQGPVSVQQQAQGADSQGLAVFADAGAGDDAYTLTSIADREVHQAGQGASLGGVAIMVEEGGNDAYAAQGEAPVHVHQLVQGIGWNGAGFLLERGGDDHYLASARGQGHLWAQGLGAVGGAGALVDEAGADTYEARAWHDIEGQTVVEVQGAGDLGALGLLWDRAGDDAYIVDALQIGAGIAQLGAQGSAANEALGALLDDGGNDSYTVTATQLAYNLAAARAQGAGGDGGAGVLVDHLGGDRYEFNVAQTVTNDALAAAQGAGQAQGAGVLLEEEGDDAYGGAVTQSGNTRRLFVRGAADLGVGLFTDLAGADAYAGQGADGTTWFQGTIGVGVDQ
jgi:hypothetical protein